MLDWRIGRGQRVELSPRLRQRLEQSLAAPLDATPIWFEPAQASPGLAVGGAVLLGPAAFAPGGPPPVAVLAHEFAHVLQQRRHRAGQPASPTPLIEAEAFAAACAVKAGQQTTIRVALDPREPAAWGEGGHYYTVYFAMLAAGVDEGVALRTAFYSQMGDEVSDLDAVKAGVGYVIRKAQQKDTPGFFTLMADAENYGPAVKQDPFVNLDIQQGLHTLTGELAELETLKRLAIMLNADPQKIDFGLAIHAFGDSFAHRNGDYMYKGPVGHAEDGHEPDLIGAPRAELYERYVRLLYKTAVFKFPNRKQRPAAGGKPGAPGRITEDEMMFALGGAVQITGYSSGEAHEKAVQIPAIREAAKRELGVMLADYAPEEHEDDWLGHDGDDTRPELVTTIHVKDALKLGAAWSEGASRYCAANGLDAFKSAEDYMRFKSTFASRGAPTIQLVMPKF